MYLEYVEQGAYGGKNTTFPLRTQTVFIPQISCNDISQKTFSVEKTTEDTIEWMFKLKKVLNTFILSRIYQLVEYFNDPVTIANFRKEMYLRPTGSYLLMAQVITKQAENVMELLANNYLFYLKHELWHEKCVIRINLIFLLLLDCLKLTPKSLIFTKWMMNEFVTSHHGKISQHLASIIQPRQLNKNQRFKQ